MTTCVLDVHALVAHSKAMLVVAASRKLIPRALGGPEVYLYFMAVRHKCRETKLLTYGSRPGALSPRSLRFMAICHS